MANRKKEKELCVYCNRNIAKFQMKKHLKPCKYVYDNKYRILDEYKKYPNIEIVAKHMGVSRRIIEPYFDILNIKIQSDGKIFKSKFSIDEEFFNNMQDLQHWLLGFIASDGNISGNAITVAQSGDEGRKLIEYIKNILNSNHNIYETKTNRKPSFRLCFSSKKFVKFLSKYNIVSNKSLIYSFPDIDLNFAKSFIRGYFDGDGSIGIYKTKYSHLLISSIYGNNEFINKIGDIIPIQGIVNQKRNKQSEIRWNGEKAILFCEWLYENEELYFGHKYNIYKNFITNYLTRFLKYRDIKINALELLKHKNCMDVARELNIPFQTIYKWRKNNVKNG